MHGFCTGVICRPDTQFMQFKCFLADVAESLIEVTSSSRRPSFDSILQPPTKVARVQGNLSNDVRKDGFDHMPCYNEKRQRCLSCKSGLSYTSCKKCNTWLCLYKERNCFEVFSFISNLKYSYCYFYMKVIDIK